MLTTRVEPYCAIPYSTELNTKIVVKKHTDTSMGYITPTKSRESILFFVGFCAINDLGRLKSKSLNCILFTLQKIVFKQF